MAIAGCTSRFLDSVMVSVSNHAPAGASHHVNLDLSRAPSYEDQDCVSEPNLQLAQRLWFQDTENQVKAET